MYYSGAYLFAGWHRDGTVLSGVAPDETNNVYEPIALYEGSPQIIAGPNVFKLWYSSGVAAPGIHYAESADGQTWTKYGSNPVLNSRMRPALLKDGATYYLFVSNGDTQIDLYSSNDGLAWTLVSASVLALGSAGAWDATHLANSFVWKEGIGDYRMLYEANGVGVNGGNWAIGYATSANLTAWTKSGSNPVITEALRSVGGPFVYKANSGTYWAWVHHAASGSLPTDIERFRSSNLTAWTKDPASRNALSRITSDEGAGTSVGQTADPTLLELSGQTYLYYSATPDGSQASGHLHIKRATFNGTMEQLILTTEGQ